MSFETVNSKLLDKEFEQLGIDLIKKHDELGMRASGAWAGGIEHKIKDKKGGVKATLLGLSYTGALQFGRKPTQRSGGGLREKIETWIENKGITSNIPIRSLAFLIARKIHKEGTASYPEGTDLIDSVITTKRIDNIIEKLGVIDVEVIVSGMVSEIEKLKNT